MARTTAGSIPVRSHARQKPEDSSKRLGPTNQRQCQRIRLDGGSKGIDLRIPHGGAPDGSPIERVSRPIGPYHTAPLPCDLEVVALPGTQIDVVVGFRRLAVRVAQGHRQGQIRRSPPCGATVGHCGEPAPPLDDPLQRRDHRFREEREGVSEVALAGSVSSDEEGGVVEIDLLSRNAPEAEHVHPAERGIDHSGPRTAARNAGIRRAHSSARVPAYSGGGMPTTRPAPAGPRSVAHWRRTRKSTRIQVVIRLNMHEAKTHLSRYVARLREGEAILLCRRNEPVAEIRALPRARTKRRAVRLGPRTVHRTGLVLRAAARRHPGRLREGTGVPEE